MQLDGIIWEEDSIAYGCENATLVLNNQKGLLRKNYACLESGRYQTPDGKDTPWPVCTTKPTDPCEFTCIWSAHVKSLACEQTSLRLRLCVFFEVQGYRPGGWESQGVSSEELLLNNHLDS